MSDVPDFRPAIRAGLEDQRQHEEERTSHPLTELGDAQRFADIYGNQVRFCARLGGWMYWDGRRWQRDTTGEVERAAKRLVTVDMAEEAAQLAAKDSAELLKHAAKCQGRRTISNILALAQTEKPIAAAVEEFDANPYALNCLNGTLSLDRGGFHLKPHDPADNITQLAGVAYDPDATSERFTQFLEEVLPDPDVRAYVQRAAGLSLFGEVREHILLLLYGTGANGKSTFLEALLHVAGDYGQTAAPGILLSHRHEMHPTGVADLRGARFVSTTEPDTGKRLAESVVKQLTGGDTVKARYMRQDFFEITPTWTIWLAANHRPEIRGNDEGIWRRPKLIPFEVQIPKERRDPDLLKKLEAEGSGILNWMLEGLAAYYANGLQEPDAVSMAVEDYRRESDPIGQFLDECTVQSSVGSVPKGKLFQAWKDWCDENNVQAGSTQQFSRRLKDRGVEDFRTGSTRFWEGIRLRTEDDERRDESVVDMTRRRRSSRDTDEIFASSGSESA